jgi:hypothetical protein
MTYSIPEELYDGLLHAVAFERGPDSIAKWNTLLADGFTVAIRGETILACKIMCGEPIPAMAA